ncbi:hypothetical protein BB560_000434 [Smittium megazygosporum]|uniref:Uncharacterized protein n=1 Tax=Smittium megazygosporum TaxID=133381 RepID=A0A2T9ZKK6_9FUNG|nr:hypothetical protein BB560_000434 [Smittium megazygosporum]
MAAFLSSEYKMRRKNVPVRSPTESDICEIPGVIFSFPSAISAIRETISEDSSPLHPPKKASLDKLHKDLNELTSNTSRLYASAKSNSRKQKQNRLDFSDKTRFSEHFQNSKNSLFGSYYNNNTYYQLPAKSKLFNHGIASSTISGSPSDSSENTILPMSLPMPMTDSVSSHKRSGSESGVLDFNGREKRERFNENSTHHSHKFASSPLRSESDFPVTSSVSNPLCGAEPLQKTDVDNSAPYFPARDSTSLKNVADRNYTPGSLGGYAHSGSRLDKSPNIKSFVRSSGYSTAHNGSDNSSSTMINGPNGFLDELTYVANSNRYPFGQNAQAINDSRKFSNSANSAIVPTPASTEHHANIQPGFIHSRINVPQAQTYGSQHQDINDNRNPSLSLFKAVDLYSAKDGLTMHNNTHGFGFKNENRQKLKKDSPSKKKTPKTPKKSSTSSRVCASCKR